MADMNNGNGDPGDASTSTPDTPHMTRRKFLTYGGVAGAGALAGGVVGSVLTRIFANGQTQALTTYPRVNIANIRNLQVGKPVSFDYPLQGQSSYLLKLGSPALDGIGTEKDIVAFSAICVHMGCSLMGRYQDKHKILGPCPCHLSTYDLALGGQPVIGVATENLPQLELSMSSQGDIFAEGVWGVIYGFENNLQPGTPVRS